MKRTTTARHAAPRPGQATAAAALPAGIAEAGVPSVPWRTRIRYVASPAWWWCYRTVMRIRRARPWRAVRWRVQRARRGWSDADTWNLDTYLARVISGTVAHLAGHNHGYPVDSSDAEWEKTLRRIAAPLAAYSRDWELADGETWPDYKERVDAAREEVRAALYLLADHFEDLWD